MINKLLKKLSLLCLVVFFATSSESESTLIQDFDVPEVSTETYESIRTSYQYRYSYLYWSSYQYVRLPFEFEYDDYLYPANNYVRVFGQPTVQFCEPGRTTPIPGSCTYYYPYGGKIAQSYYYRRYSYWHPNNEAFRNMVSAFYGCVYYYDPPTRQYGYVYAKIDGSAPNRVAIFEWYNYNYYYGNGKVNCQIKLYEGSNKIQFHYGQFSVKNPPYNSFYWTYQSSGNGERHNMYTSYNIGMVGREGALNTANNWIQVYSPACASVSDWAIFKSSGDQGSHKSYGAHEGQAVNTAWAAMCNNLTLTFGDSNPKLVDAVPGNESLWAKGECYPYPDDQDDRYDPLEHPAAKIIRLEGMPEVNLRMEIWEKDDRENVIYDVSMTNVDVLSADKEDVVRVDMMGNGSGIAYGDYGTDVEGYLDLRVDEEDNLPPGEYMCKVTMTMPGNADFQKEVLNRITIAVNNDMAVHKIESPQLKLDKVYSIDGFDVIVIARNTGANTRDEWKLTAKVYDENHDLLTTYECNYPDDVELYEDVFEDPETTSPNEKIKVDFGRFTPDNVGDYYVKAEVTFGDGNVDQYRANNTIPRSDEDEWSYEVNIAKSIDLRADKMRLPDEEEEIEVYTGRPIKPKCSFVNLGVNDASLNEIFMVITFEGDTVYNSTLTNEPLSSRDTTIVTFYQDFVPQEEGEYNVCFWIESEEDSDPSYKTKCTTFNVIGALDGTYTIGYENEYLNNGEINPRNYIAINAAVDDLFLRGVSGNVTFELTDHEYTVGQMLPDAPALDLSSRIPNVDADHTVTFKPSEDMAMERGDDGRGVTIKLMAGNGKGLYFGQNGYPTNPNACAYYHWDENQRLSSDTMPYFVNSGGYITFDGGENKAFRFQIFTIQELNNETKYFAAPVYMAGGSSNITITNCIFENPLSETEDPHALLPRTRRESSQQEYEDEKATQGTSFSAAIVMRSKLPLYEDNMNGLNFDTLTCDNNIISNNEIYGFGYGIASMGSGPILQSGSTNYKRFYNKNNVIENNIIHDVARAGIFMGYEEYSTIRNNQIYNVTGSYAYANADQHIVLDATGILLGGEGSNSWNAYNNIGLVIENNEISNITYNAETGYDMYIKVAGIWVEQGQNQLTTPAQINQNFPDEEERFIIRNNIIHNIYPAHAQHSRYGIILNANGDADYKTRNDVVVNNTVVLEDDGFNTVGQLIGIGFQRAYEPVLKNNAIAVVDENISDESAINALVFYEGVMPETQGGMISNRNAFWADFKSDLSDKSGVAMFAYWELDRHGHRMDFNKNDYETLRQWRNWTQQDYNSVIADFRKDMEYTGNGDDRTYRVKYPYPKGSVLNNRGFVMPDYVKKDIDGNKRGVAGNLYDIGACEFTGATYLQDMEIKTVSEPSTYQSGSGMFDDAEYVMTTLPIDCKVVIRNSGSLDQSEVDVTLYVFRENASGIFEDDKALDTFNIKVDVVTAQSIEASFNLAEAEAGKHDSDRIFLTYAELRKYSDENYVIPEYFDTVMVSNVTPRYKFRIMIRPDENNDNNTMEVITRYYIKKSEELDMLISTENSWYNIRTTHNAQNPTVDQIAGRLNFEKLAEGFGDKGKGLGYYITTIDKDILHDDEDIQDSLKIDAFDRNSWEPRSVDYSMYKYMFWADGDDKALTRYQQWNIEDFINGGVIGNKKNLVIGSQEIVRNNVGDLPVIDGKRTPTDQQFVREVLRADYVAVGGNTMSTAWQGADGSDGQYTEGVAVGLGMQNNKIKYHDTKYGNGFASDVMPYCGLMDLWNEGEGLARPAYYYIQDGNRNQIDSTMGVATTTLDRNIVVLGVDWRHWENIDRVLRACIDFYEKNGGTSVPVELFSFEAEAVSNRVDISWVTAIEINTDRFEVERAELNGEFTTIAEMPAAGKSYEKKHYGPVSDLKVEYGHTYIYRLKTVDADGTTSFSDERVVEIGKGANLWLGQAAPNPASSEVSFDFNRSKGSQVELVIYDINGNMVEANYELTSTGMSLNLSTMSSGRYTLLVNVDGEMMTRQFQVVK